MVGFILRYFLPNRTSHGTRQRHHESLMWLCLLHASCDSQVSFMLYAAGGCGLVLAVNNNACVPEVLIHAPWSVRHGSRSESHVYCPAIVFRSVRPIMSRVKNLFAIAYVIIYIHLLRFRLYTAKAGKPRVDRSIYIILCFLLIQ